MKKLFCSGGLGFLGTNFIRMLVKDKNYYVVNYDAITYAGNPENLEDLKHRANYSFRKGDICDKEKVMGAMKGSEIIIHYAACSHVDRSITNPSEFVRTNVLGTNVILGCAEELKVKKVVFISTDEIYGSQIEGYSKETDMMNPSSPYSASKAAGDLLCRAYFKTYGLPVVVVRCSNNFGPYQYPEKLFPLFITNLIDSKKVPIYGTGENVRDWIYVEDCVEAIKIVMEEGRVGEVYNIGGGNLKTNLEITEQLLTKLKKGKEFIKHVKDRLGHDFRYALNCIKIREELGWSPKHSFDKAVDKTIKWYKDNESWWRRLK